MKNRTRRPEYPPLRPILCLAATLLLTAGAASAMTGDEVVLRARETSRAINDRSMRVTMRIIEPGGTERVRVLHGYEKQASGDWKILWIFQSPADLVGTSFLALPQPDAADRLFVYFPAQRRVRQVADAMRHERFQGSDFTFEDLAAMVFITYDGTHRLEREESCGDAVCSVVETTLPAGRFAYTRLETWFRQDTALPERVEFFDPEPLKVMRTLKVERVAGVTMITSLEMENLRSHDRTRVDLEALHVNEGVEDNLFSVEHLTHGK